MALDPVLYSFRRCPYAIRARLALVISDTTCVLREVNLARKPPEMLAVSPKGTVPVLALPDGTVVDESLPIMRWALSRNDPEGWLGREDAELIAYNDGSFKYDLDRCKYPERHQSSASAHRQSGLDFLRILDARLAISDHLCGAERGITDAAIMPFVRQFAAVDQDWFAAQPLRYLHAWLADHLASPLFAIVMVRIAPWAPNVRPLLLPLQLTRVSQPSSHPQGDPEMSVAFRRDSDEEHLEPKFELPIPAGPNLVTVRGLALIQRRIEELEDGLRAADETAAAAIKRDLRYWQTRKTTAELAPIPAGHKVEFGVRVSIKLNGRPRTFLLVGDDEAEPSAGSISFKAPLSQAMLGAEVGETLPFNDDEEALEILQIEVARELSGDAA